MRLPLLQLPAVFHSAHRGPAWIGVGLGVMLLNAWWPAVPVVTAMALVAAGAMGVTAERFRAAPSGQLVIVLNLLVYCGLYALFIGATLHPALLRVDHRLSAMAAIDLALSTLPLAMALDQTWRVLQRCRPAK